MIKKAVFCKKNLTVLTIIVAALILRGLFLNRILEYDEIWTLKNYAPLDFTEIFQELATPNNHPVNTLIIKFISGFSGSFRCLRLGSLFFSFGTILLGGCCARRIYGRTAALYTMIALAVLPPFITAGATARGYSGQLFFLVLFCFCLIKCRKGNIFFTLLGAISAITAIVSLPSSIIFLAVPGTFFLFTMWKSEKLQKIHVYSFGAALFFTFLWFFRNWYSFEQNQNFAVQTAGFKEFITYFITVLHSNLIPVTLLLIMIFFKRHRKSTFLLAAMIAFPLLSMSVTGKAPARVYLPCAVPALILLMPDNSIKYHRMIFPAILLFLLFISFSTLPQTPGWEKCINSPDSPGMVKIYGANDGFTIKFNHPSSREKFAYQLINSAPLDKISIQLCGIQNIEGLNRQFQTVSFPLEKGKKNGCGIMISLRKSSFIPANRIAFLLLPPMPEKSCEMVLKLFDEMELIQLNPWFSAPFYNSLSGENFRYMLLAIRDKKDRIFPKNLPLFIATD